MIKIVKSSVSKPFRSVHCQIDFGKGINYWKSIAMYLDKGIIKGGTWKSFEYKGKKVAWQNDDGLKKVLTLRMKKAWRKHVRES